MILVSSDILFDFVDVFGELFDGVFVAVEGIYLRQNVPLLCFIVLALEVEEVIIDHTFLQLLQLRLP